MRSNANLGSDLSSAKNPQPFLSKICDVVRDAVRPGMRVQPQPAVEIHVSGTQIAGSDYLPGDEIGGCDPPKNQVQVKIHPEIYCPPATTSCCCC